MKNWRLKIGIKILKKNYVISGSIHPKSKLKLTGREERRAGG